VRRRPSLDLRSTSAGRRFQRAAEDLGLWCIRRSSIP